jgi:hypothetical protein
VDAALFGMCGAILSVRGVIAMQRLLRLCQKAGQARSCAAIEDTNASFR